MADLADDSHDFELLALHVAQSIHDPSGAQGSLMHKGRERDGLFISSDAVHAYEFTTDRKKAKAEKDASKLRELLLDLSASPEHRHKTFVGWFVTREEPTADQRKAVTDQLRPGLDIRAISFKSLQGRICDSERYLAVRDEAPFGSTNYARSSEPRGHDVPVQFVSGSEGSLSTKEVADQLLDGRRFLLTGEFGVGKSHALRDIYRELRRKYFRHQSGVFPVHLNLRDCVGLRSPFEILRRHAEEIGFTDDRGLTSAWRAGSCVLILDGFDELIPTRWLGSATDLRTVRWEALAPIRRLVSEAPSGTGIVLGGRAHYFASTSEMTETLGFATSSSLLSIDDFSEDQVRRYLEASSETLHLPEWLPAKPLLLGHLLATGALGRVSDSASASPAEFWRELLSLICRREAEMFSAVRPETVKSLIARVATLARGQGDPTGPVTIDDLRTAYTEVTGRPPDEEGLQMLLRLPGLGVTSSPHSEARLFVDSSLAEVAYGEDLALHIQAPFINHPLREASSWIAVADTLAVMVAAEALQQSEVTAKAVQEVAKRRQDLNLFDAVLADAILVAEEMGPRGEPSHSFTVQGVSIPQLTVSAESMLIGRMHLQDSLIESLDLTEADSSTELPTFRRCLIAKVDGVASIPPQMQDSFVDCEIGEFSDTAKTNAGILQMPIPVEKRVALTVLKKVYGQRGTGRKEGALWRGMGQAERELVKPVVAALVADGWLTKGTAGRSVVYFPVKTRRSAAMQALEAPNDFYLKV